MKDIKKHPLAVYDGKYHYFRQDFVADVCKNAAKTLAKDFEKRYIAHNITEPSAEGEDVDVRLEQSIASMNMKNIKHTGEYLAEYFGACAKLPTTEG